MLGDIVNEECTDGPTVVAAIEGKEAMLVRYIRGQVVVGEKSRASRNSRRGDCSVSLLTSYVKERRFEEFLDQLPTLMQLDFPL